MGKKIDDTRIKLEKKKIRKSKRKIKQKTGKGPEETFPQRRCNNGQQVYEKINQHLSLEECKSKPC